MYSREEILKANIKIHTKLAPYYSEEPTYKPENIKRVTKIVRGLKGDSLLDIGCGTGFIIDIAKKYFHKVVGIDATPAMLKRVDTKGGIGTVEVQKGNCEALPFPRSSFDVCTAYALLHHLMEIEPTLKEAYRVLKIGGVLYTDQDPNREFWDTLMPLPEGTYSPIVGREIQSVKGEAFELKYVDGELFKKAEYLKFSQGGFLAHELESEVLRVGFRKCRITYNWFLGERSYIQYRQVDRTIRFYLKKILPLSSHLFKYLSIIAVK